MKILIVEDDTKIAKALTNQLEYDGMSTVVLNSGSEAIDVIKIQRPDFVILDVMLPGKDGLTICREIRQFSMVPIMMLTAKVGEIDRLKGLDLGADDYVCKPFFPREVSARIQVIFRRSELQLQASKPVLSCRGMTLDYERYLCKVDGEVVPLTVTEFQLLYQLAQSSGMVLTREDLIKTYSFEGLKNVNSVRAVDNHIKNLRKKLTQASSDAEYIHSIYGVGYKLE